MKHTRLGIMLFLLLVPVPCAPLLAQQPPVLGPAGSDRRELLFDRLKNAKTEAAGRIAEDAVWQMWMAQAPSEAIAQDVKAAMDARESYDYDRAMALLDGVVAAAPDHAEGWNQRAFIRFLQGDLDGSLADLDRTIELEPKHFAALSGKAIIFMQQGRTELGQTALREAVAIHPWLKERSMLVPEPENPDRDGKEI